ncbi:MAG: IS66 family insertion sequence element accessory protein TnpB [Aminobacterium colombiense]|nr:IS66 family insertion sequence element accessory protein TnpB [Aminobacterium colombiense]
MFSLNDSMRYLFYSEPTDMRKSFHTLSGLVTNNMGRNVRDGDVFIFVNKARNRIKLLHMEPGGLVIYSKLLEEGRFRVPSLVVQNNSITMQWVDLVMMVEGIISDPGARLKRLKRVNF